MLGGLDFKHTPASAEDQIKTRVPAGETLAQQKQGMYLEAARRVVLHNCLEKAGFKAEAMRYFDKNFYIKHQKEARQAFTCYNERMMIHLGEEDFEKYSMEMNFDSYKAEYKSYLNWNPRNQWKSIEKDPIPQEKQTSLIENLKKKSDATRYHKFDFN